MDAQRIISILGILGIPAAISAVLTGLVKALSDGWQRRSTEALVDWLGQASALEPFQGDDKALRALLELRQSLVFHRAFGLKTESQLRNELLLFAESKRESTRFHEVLQAGRIFSRAPLDRLDNPKWPKKYERASRVSKVAGYLYIGLGYILGYISMIGWMPLPYSLHLTGRLSWASVAFGFVLGTSFVAGGIAMLKMSRRSEIAADFLRWRSENRKAK